jgi:chromosome segregation protein
MLIFKNGDVYGKTYQIIRSKNGANINVLARKKQLDELSSNLPLIKKSFEKANDELSQIQEESKSKEEEFANERNNLFESDKLKQEIEFNIKLATNKSEDLSSKIEGINNEKSDLEKIIEDTITQLKDNSIENFEADLKIKVMIYLIKLKI